MKYIISIMRGIFLFLGMFGALSFLGLGFNMLTTRYCVIGGIEGTVVDFSLYCWLALALFWGVAIALYKKRQLTFGVWFATQLTIFCGALEVWNFVMYAADYEQVVLLRGLLLTELLFGIFCVREKAKNEALLSFATLLAILLGNYMVVPLYLSTEEIFATGCVFSLLGAAAATTHWKKVLPVSFFIACIGCAGYVWYQTPGIKFYEKRITEPAKNVKVSIVIPVYNGAKYIRKGLDSLRKQTLKDIEIICVNDGSKDNSEEILKEYAAHDARIKFVSQKNQYIGAARNKGISLAGGEYVGFMDQDDTVSPNYYEEMYKAAQKYDADMAVAGNRAETAGYGYQHNRSRQEGNVITEYIENNQLVVNGYVWDKIYRRSFLEKYNIKSSLRRQPNEDYYFLLQALLRANKLVVAKKATNFYFLHGLSTSHTQGGDYDGQIALLQEMVALVKQGNFPPEKERLWLEMLRHYRKKQIFFAKRSNDFRKKYEEAFPEDNIDWSKRRNYGKLYGIF